VYPGRVSTQAQGNPVEQLMCGEKDHHGRDRRPGVVTRLGAEPEEQAGSCQSTQPAQALHPDGCFYRAYVFCRARLYPFLQIAVSEQGTNCTPLGFFVLIVGVVLFWAARSLLPASRAHRCAAELFVAASTIIAGFWAFWFEIRGRPRV